MGGQRFGTSGRETYQVTFLTVVVSMATAEIVGLVCDVAVMIAVSTVPLTATVGTDRLIRKVVVRPAFNCKGRFSVPVTLSSEAGQPCEEVASKAKVSVVVPVFVRTCV